MTDLGIFAAGAPLAGAPYDGPKTARQGLEALARWLAVRQGFEPLSHLLPAGLVPYAQGYFDACVGRWEGADLRVYALLADEGGVADLPVHRAEAFRRTLADVEGMVRGRLKVGVWLVVDQVERAEELKDRFLTFEDAHFLSKTVVGRGLLCMKNGWGGFVGRTTAKPDAGELAAALIDKSVDPGLDEAERIRLERETLARNRDRDERSAARLLRPGPAPVTWFLIGLNTAVYSVQLMLANAFQGRGVSDDVAASTAMLKLGANERGLTLAGQWWRLLASAFLHGGWWHLGMNMYALFLVGAVAERLMGPWRFLALYLFSALCAGLLSVLTAEPGTYSVGASGAIMGVIGLLLAPRFKKDARFPEALADRLFQWLIRPVVFIFILGLALRLFDVPLLLDNAAHLGGLLSGFALGYLWPSFLVRPIHRQA